MEGRISSFTELLIWKKGMQITRLTYKITQNFPKDELFGLTSQMRRAAISIPSNISEGWGRNTSKSYVHFLRISRGSLCELETQLILAKELEFISVVDFEKIESEIREESKMLNAFISKVEKDIKQ